jgi:hypothetical protein
MNFSTALAVHSDWDRRRTVVSAMELSMRFQMLAGVAVLGSALALVVGCSTSPDKSLSLQSPPGTKTKIILLRYAEKDVDEEEEMREPRVDIGLSPEGKLRAQALVDAIGDSGVTAIYCPALRQNIQTAQPLANHLGLKLNLVAPTRLLNSSKLAKELLGEILTKQAGGTVVWVGDPRSLVEIYEMVDGTGSPPVDYGDLYTIIVPDIGTIRIKKSTYGE